MAASQLESQVAAFEKELTCPLCAELYTEPVLLPCSHAFCAGCVENLAQCPSCSCPFFSQDTSPSSALREIILQFGYFKRRLSASLEGKLEGSSSHNPARGLDDAKQAWWRAYSEVTRKLDVCERLLEERIPADAAYSATLCRQLGPAAEGLKECYAPPCPLAGLYIGATGGPSRGSPGGGGDVEATLRRQAVPYPPVVRGPEHSPKHSNVHVFEDSEAAPASQPPPRAGKSSRPALTDGNVAMGAGTMALATAKRAQAEGLEEAMGTAGGKAAPPPSHIQLDGSAAMGVGALHPAKRAKASPVTGKGAATAARLPQELVLIGSGLAEDGTKLVKEAARKLGGIVVQKWSPEVTHIVTDTLQFRGKHLANRTLKHMQGVLLGQWIVGTSWVRESLAKGCWLPEASFEVDGDQPTEGQGAPRKAREACSARARQLFAGVHVYLHGRFSQSKRALVDLIEIGGACLHQRISDLQATVARGTPKLALVICESQDVKAEFTQRCAVLGLAVVSPKWLHDSISHYAPRECEPYLVEPTLHGSRSQ